MITTIRSCAAVCLVALGCGAEPSSSTILVGALYDRSGVASDPSRVDGFNLGILHVNEALRRAGYKGLQLEVRLEDGGARTDIAIERAVHLAREEGVKVISVDATQPAVDVNGTFYDDDPTNDLDVPIVCSACAGTTLNLPGKPPGDPSSNSKQWLLRTVMSNQLVTRVMAQYLGTQGANRNGDVNGDGRIKIVIYATNEAFGLSSSASAKGAIEAGFPPVPPPIVEQLTVSYQVDIDSYDWGSDLAAIQDNETGPATDVYPDYVLSFLLPQVNVGFVRTARNSGFALPVLYANTARLQTTIDTLGNLGDGMSGIAHVYVDPGASANLFQAAYLERYGIKAPYRTGNFYDAAILIGLAIVKATAILDDPTGVTGNEVRDALWAVMRPGGEQVYAGPDELERAIRLLTKGQAVDYQGVSGPLDIDDLGNVRQNLARWEVVDREFVDKEIYHCIDGDECRP